MADEPARLILLEEEREGDQEGSDDFVFRRIGESVPIFSDESSFDLQSPPYKALSISDRFGALFLAHSEGFLVIKTKDAIDLAKKVKEKGKGPSLEDSSLVNVQIGRVSLLEMSNDSSMLAASIVGDIYFFSVSSLLKKNQKPVFSCSLNKSGVIKDFKWLEKGAKSYIVLSDYGSLHHGDFEGEMKDILDSVDAVDCSPDGKSIVIIRKNNLSILSLDFEEQLRMPLSFESWSDSENTKMDSIGWIRDDSIILGATQLNDNEDEEGYFVQVITSGNKSFSESSCKPIAFSFPNLFEGLLDDIIPSNCGPHLLLSYLTRWGILLVSNKKNIDQHVVLLKYSLNEGTNEVVSLEFQNDKYNPRIDLQENGDDNTIVGFGVEKVSLFEKITIQAGTEVQELAPQYIMACLTCEGKLILYHVARASDPSELPQHDIVSDYEENVSTPEVPTTVTESKIPEKELLDNTVPESKIPESKVPESKIPESKVPEIKIPENTSSPSLSKGGFGLNTQSRTSPFKLEFGTVTQNAPTTQNVGQIGMGTQNVPSSTASRFTVTESKATNETSSPSLSKGGFGLNTRGMSPFKLEFGTGTQNAPTTQTFGQIGMGTQNVPSSAASRFTVTESKAANETSSPSLSKGGFGLNTQSGTSPFKLGFGTGTQNAPTMQPSGQIGTSSDSTSSPLKGAFNFAKNEGLFTQSPSKPFGTIDSTQKEGLFTQSPSKPFGNIDSTKKDESSLIQKETQKEGFKPFSGASLKLGANENKLVSSPSTSGFSGAGFGAPKQNLETKPGNFEEISARNVAKPVMKSEKESEQDLSNKFYSVKDITKELESLLTAIEKEVGFTSQQNNILLSLDENLKTLSQFSRTCKSNVEEQLEMMQDLRDKMSQVSSRQVYMESIVNQSSDNRYWDVWNSQKLPFEFELKRQNIFKSNQSLTSQLTELERHFNTLEINQFGEVGFNRRNLHPKPSLSKETQSLNRVYNTANSQLATAEQLSLSLSKQISMLNISSSPSPSRTPNPNPNPNPNPPGSKRVGSVKKILFESIGLSYEPDHSYTSPPPTSKRGSEPETSRRRREDFISSVEPQKTTVKRISSAQKEKSRFSIGSDKKFKSNIQIERTVNRTGSFDVSIPPPPRLLESSIVTQGTDNEEKTKKQAQQSAVFKWAKESSSSSQNTEPKPSEPPKFSLPFQSPFSTTQTSASIAKPFSNVSPMKSQPGQPSFGLKTGEDSSKPSGFSFSLSSMSNQSTEASASPFMPKPRPSIFGKSTLPEEIKKEESLSEMVPTFVPKPIISSFGKSNEQDRKDKTGTSFGIGSPEKLVQVSVPTSVSSSSPPKPVPEPTAFSSPTKPVQAAPLPTSSSFVSSPVSSPVKSSVPVSSPALQPSASTNSFSSPPISSPVKLSFPATSSSLSSPPVSSQVKLSFPATSSSFSSPPVSSPLKFVAPASPPAALQPSTTSSNFTSPPVSSPVQLFPPTTPPQVKEEEDEMEEEASDTITNQLDFNSLSGFGLGSVPASTPTQPKPNPFGTNLFNNTPSSPTPTPTPTLTPSTGMLFRPASLSFSSPQQSIQQQSSPSPSPFSNSGFGQPAQVGSGFTGFGQPPQIGAGQQVLGSVLGSFGQSRQFGSNNNGSTPSGFGMSSPATGSGGFGGFASTGTSGGFAAASTGGGFAGFGSGGFSAAGSGGSGGFGGVSQGGGFGGGFGGVSNNQGSGFSSFGGTGTGPGRPPAELLSQMRK